jgi:hypothetical protein
MFQRREQITLVMVVEVEEDRLIIKQEQQVVKESL